MSFLLSAFVRSCVLWFGLSLGAQRLILSPKCTLGKEILFALFCISSVTKQPLNSTRITGHDPKPVTFISHPHNLFLGKRFQRYEYFLIKILYAFRGSLARAACHLPNPKSPTFHCSVTAAGHFYVYNPSRFSLCNIIIFFCLLPSLLHYPRDFFFCYYQIFLFNLTCLLTPIKQKLKKKTVPCLIKQHTMETYGGPEV